MAKAPKQSFVPSQLDLELYAGDGASLAVSVKNAVGAAVPITGAVAAQIRTSRSDPAALASWAVDLTNAATGIAVISLTGAQTAALINGTGEVYAGFWDVQWTPAGGQPITLSQGKLTCTPDVTRS
jgi:hypothetical protein